MKTILILIFGSFLFCHRWKMEPEQEAQLVARATEPASDTLRFAVHIQPILQNKCNPCHFPGGKMYEAMPFDQAETTLKHPEGMLKRINSGEEGRLLRAFLDSHE